MDDHSLKVLDYFHLLHILKEYTISSLGQKCCEALRPLTDPPSIQKKMAEVLEFKEILETLGEPPLHGIKDIEVILKRLEVEGSSLTLQEIIEILDHIELCKRIKRFFRKAEAIRIPYLQERISKLSSLKVLEKEILQSIDKKGEILDRASPNLSDIRDRLRELREKAKKMLEHLLHREDLQPIFQEPLITLRNGRYVLPIKADAEHRLEGIIHDHSQSRMTYFLEPFQLIGMNNEINILVAEEKEEEYRILTDLSEKIRRERCSLWMDVELLGELDLLSAMARLSLRLKGIRPFLNEEGRVDMKEARNPLLTLQDQNRVVPIDLRMGNGKKVLILSGANAGGKTVALKTLGLLTLMAQSGLPIPVAEGSHVSVFQEVFAVIGDEQNLEKNLSTFSSHLLHVDRILKKANSRSLVLLDELGVGTHASEGCALAMGFLDQFRQQGASVVVTTHFDPLKAYGYLNPDVENVAVEFDQVTLEPKYTLSYGMSGWSNAFLVAEKLGVSERVIQMARRHQDGGDQEVKRALENLERLKFELERERQQLVRMKEEATLERERLKEALEGIKRRRGEIYSRAEARVNEAVQRIEQELKEWFQRIREEKSHPGFQAYRKELHGIKEGLFPSP
ncbi:MAG: endonuclease MutS2, partial [Thermodesulfobacteriota bacterium]